MSVIIAKHFFIEIRNEVIFERYIKAVRSFCCHAGITTDQYYWQEPCISWNFGKAEAANCRDWFSDE